MSNVLIDTNILIYAWDSAEKQKQYKALRVLKETRNQACLSVQNLSEFSSFMIRNGCQLRWVQEVMSTYEMAMTILPIHSEHVQQAVKAVEQYQMSFWDAQIWAVARSNDISIIYSDDGPIGQVVEGIAYQNPLTDF